MSHPCVDEVTNTLNQLRQTSLETTVVDGSHISYNVYFSWDIINGGVEIALKSPVGALLNADVIVRGKPKWFTLNIGLGRGKFAIDDTIGLVVDASCSVPIDLCPFVRSAESGDKHDTMLSECIKLGPNTGSSILLHTVESHEPVSWAGQFHTLVIPLPKQNFTLDLKDMRLIHVDAAKGLRARQRVMTSIAY